MVQLKLKCSQSHYGNNNETTTTLDSALPSLIPNETQPGMNNENASPSSSTTSPASASASGSTAPLIPPDMRSFAVHISGSDALFLQFYDFILVYFICLCVIFMHDSFLVWFVSAVVVLARYLHRNGQVKEEKLVVVRNFGVQLCRTHFSGSESSTFVEMARVKGLYLNEVIRSYTVHYILVLVVAPSIGENDFDAAGPINPVVVPIRSPRTQQQKSGTGATNSGGRTNSAASSASSPAGHAPQPSTAPGSGNSGHGVKGFPEDDGNIFSPSQLSDSDSDNDFGDGAPGAAIRNRKEKRSDAARRQTASLRTRVRPSAGDEEDIILLPFEELIPRLPELLTIYHGAKELLDYAGEELASLDSRRAVTKTSTTGSLKPSHAKLLQNLRRTPSPRSASWWPDS